MKFKDRFKNLIGIETKSGLAVPDDWFFDQLGGLPVASGVRVTPKTAMTCAPVRAAVQAISEAIGQLPVHVYQRDAKGVKERAPNHPISSLLREEANDWTTAQLFREQITRDALLYPRGGFAFINRAGDGKPVELIRIDPEQSTVIVETENFEPVYKVQTGNGDPVTYDRQNIFHIPSPALSDRGLVYEARETIGVALTLEQHAARLFGNGARPSGLISLKNVTTPDALAKAKAAWQASNSGIKSGGTAVLPADAQWQSIALDPVSSQYLDLFRFYIDQIARVFRVPPTMLFELGRATWANGEQQGQSFLNFCLMAWVKRWEGQIRLKLFTPDERGTFFAEFLTDDLARADLAARSAAYTAAVGGPWLLPNEARAAENRAPVEGGDVLRPPANATNVRAAA